MKFEHFKGVYFTAVRAVHTEITSEIYIENFSKRA